MSISNCGFLPLNRVVSARYSLGASSNIVVPTLLSDINASDSSSAGVCSGPASANGLSAADSSHPVRSDTSHQSERPFKPPVVARIKRNMLGLVAGLCLLILTLSLIGCLMPGGIAAVMVCSLAVIPCLSLIIFSLVSIFYRKKALLFSREFKKLETENARLKSRRGLVLRA
ncbi:MAG: hypothetical protein RRZ67_04490 [Victivallaceae bacterium]